MLDLERLQQALAAAGLAVQDLSYPWDSVTGEPATTYPQKEGRALRVKWQTPPSPAQIAAANDIIQAHDGRPRRRRTLTAILAQLDALNGLTQKPVLWTQLTTGALWDVPGTTNYPATAVAVLNASGAGAALLNMQMRAVALYVQDYPLWLVNPSFAPTINIPGDEVIP